MKKKKIKKSKEELKFENEVRKAKMQLEKGAVIQGNTSLPPEIESMFLDHIDKFDKAYNSCKTTTVFNRLGKPGFIPVAEIPDKKIKKELALLHSKLGRKGLIVESICGVEDREMYRFITEELFDHEIDDISIKGMMTHFIYEEFHPNHEYDIKRHTEDFTRSIMSDREKVNEYLLGNRFKTSSGKVISSKKALESINLFRSFYADFELTQFDIRKLIITGKPTRAEINFNIAYEGTIQGTREKQLFSGPGKATLLYKWDFWTIYAFEMPGLQLR